MTTCDAACQLSSWQLAAMPVNLAAPDHCLSVLLRHSLQGFAHKNPPPVGPYSPCPGTYGDPWGVGVSYERGTPVGGGAWHEAGHRDLELDQRPYLEYSRAYSYPSLFPRGGPAQDPILTVFSSLGSSPIAYLVSHHRSLGYRERRCGLNTKHQSTKAPKHQRNFAETLRQDIAYTHGDMPGRMRARPRWG